MRKNGRTKKFLQETRWQYQSIDSSRDVYSSIRKANKLLRKVRDLENGVSWNESLTGWAWVRRKIIEFLECIGFELLLVLQKVLFGLAVLAGWILVLALVILWLRGLS